MTKMSGLQFEDEVRNIARNLYSNSIGQGSQNVKGRERDGVFWNGEFYTVIEATADKRKEKAENDGKKTHDLVNDLRKEGHLVRGLLVTLHEPTPEQKEIVHKRFFRTTKILSFDEFRSLLFDSQRYIQNRSNRRFGSVYDHVDQSSDVPLGDFVEPTVSYHDASKIFPLEEIKKSILQGEKFLLVADYGIGKSMMLRHLFFQLVEDARKKKNFKTPIAINLRDHLGQSDPIELLERHARANAVEPRQLVAAWNAGYLDILIDGFDELSTRGWTGDVKKLREYRRSSHSVVRKLVQETPKGCGIIISGREAYFDSESEMRQALAAPEGKFDLLRVHPFDENQALKFLEKKGYDGPLPEWIPARPLLLTYLVTKGLLRTAVEANSEGYFPRGTAWLSLLEMIAERESDQSEGIDKSSLLDFFGALAFTARQSHNHLASFSPQDMEEIFYEITGASVMEDERNILLRLPGLGAAPDNALHRSFIDRDLMNACCALPNLKYTRDPYSDYSRTYDFGSLAVPMNDVGVEATTMLFIKSGIDGGKVGAAIERAISDDMHQMSYDIFRAAETIYDIKGPMTFEGIEVDEVDLSVRYDSQRMIDFSSCLVNKVYIPSPDETNANIMFTECLIGSIEGRISERDLSRHQFIECEISSFTDDFAVNNDVLNSGLPIGIRVLIVTLRKIYTQSGPRRLESALYRGLDQRSKMIVPRVIDLLVSHGFIVKNGRQGKVSYSGTKNKRGEALSIIQKPNEVRSGIVDACNGIS